MAKSQGIQSPVPVTLTADERTALLEAVRADPNVSHVATLRRLGVQGTKGQLHRAIDGELRTRITAIRSVAMAPRPGGPAAGVSPSETAPWASNPVPRWARRRGVPQRDSPLGLESGALGGR